MCRNVAKKTGHPPGVRNLLKIMEPSIGRSVISSLQYELKRAGLLKQDYETDKEVLFGEHITSMTGEKLPLGPGDWDAMSSSAI